MCCSSGGIARSKTMAPQDLLRLLGNDVSGKILSGIKVNGFGSRRGGDEHQQKRTQDRTHGTGSSDQPAFCI